MSEPISYNVKYDPIPDLEGKFISYQVSNEVSNQAVDSVETRIWWNIRRVIVHQTFSRIRKNK